MPLAGGRWKTFGQCVGAQKRMGHSDESARRICGKIQAETEGASASSQDTKDSASYGMSAQEMQREKKPDDGDGGGEKVTLSMQQAEALANAAFNDDLETVKKILTDVLDIEQEQEAPPGPPMK